jgi:hypothetical protein
MYMDHTGCHQLHVLLAIRPTRAVTPGLSLPGVRLITWTTLPSPSSTGWKCVLTAHNVVKSANQPYSAVLSMAGSLMMALGNSRTFDAFIPAAILLGCGGGAVRYKLNPVDP